MLKVTKKDTGNFPRGEGNIMGSNKFLNLFFLTYHLLIAYLDQNLL
jgi:hypothetical protein